MGLAQGLIRRLVPPEAAAVTVAGLVLIASIASVPTASGAAPALDASRPGPRLVIGGGVLAEDPPSATATADPFALAEGSTGGTSMDDGTLFRPVIVQAAGLTAIAVPASPKPTAKPAAHAAVKKICQGCTKFAPLAWPVPGGYISQPFGCTGFIYEPPYGSCPHFHSGIDIAAPWGTPILAAATGTVVFAGWNSNGGGLQVWIRHSNGMYTGYHHMSSVAVRVGQVVRRGQRIGRVGMTGNATGPHCHFMVTIGPIGAGGRPVDPRRYL